MKKVSYGFITISKGRTFVTLSDGQTAGFPHFPDGVNHTEAAIQEARVWTKDRTKNFEIRDER
jgi:hypothetical protein